MEPEGARPREEARVGELDRGARDEAEIGEAAAQDIVAVDAYHLERYGRGDLREAGGRSHGPFNQKAPGDRKGVETLRARSWR